MNDERWKQKFILWKQGKNDESAEDHPMSDEWWKHKNIWWMMKAEDHEWQIMKTEIILWMMNGEGWRQRTILWMMNDESKRTYDPHTDIIMERDNGLSTNPIAAKSCWIPLPYKKGNHYPQSQIPKKGKENNNAKT